MGNIDNFCKELDCKESGGKECQLQWKMGPYEGFCLNFVVVVVFKEKSNNSEFVC